MTTSQQLGCYPPWSNDAGGSRGVDRRWGEPDARAVDLWLSGISVIRCRRSCSLCRATHDDLADPSPQPLTIWLKRAVRRPLLRKLTP